MSDYCEFCGDEVDEQTLKHLNVQKCVSLCPDCGGLKPGDERWETREGDRCDCDVED